MVIDTSAVVAIAFNEPEAGIYEQKVVDAPRRFMSAATLLELTIVIEARLGEAGTAELDLWLHKAGVEIVGVGLVDGQVHGERLTLVGTVVALQGAALRRHQGGLAAGFLDLVVHAAFLL